MQTLQGDFISKKKNLSGYFVRWKKLNSSLFLLFLQSDKSEKSLLVILRRVRRVLSPKPAPAYLYRDRSIEDRFLHDLTQTIKDLKSPKSKAITTNDRKISIKVKMKWNEMREKCFYRWTEKTFSTKIFHKSIDSIAKRL